MVPQPLPPQVRGRGAAGQPVCKSASAASAGGAGTGRGTPRGGARRAESGVHSKCGTLRTRNYRRRRRSTSTMLRAMLTFGPGAVRATRPKARVKLTEVVTLGMVSFRPLRLLRLSQPLGVGRPRRRQSRHHADRRARHVTQWGGMLRGELSTGGRHGRVEHARMHRLLQPHRAYTLRVPVGWREPNASVQERRLQHVRGPRASSSRKPGRRVPGRMEQLRKLWRRSRASSGL